MTLHKLTAGDGYTYLTRQVAAFDATERGHTGLGDYYAQRGESPGRWAGAGLTGLEGVSAGDPVGEMQMAALFGAGRHPDADRLESEALAAGRAAKQARAAGTLGQPFPRFRPADDGFRACCAAQFAAANAAAGRPAVAPLPAPTRARIRSGLAAAMFAEEHGRLPRDARELSGFLARVSRPAVTAVAGYDLTFSPVKSVSALWAVAPREVAEQVEAAHTAAVADTLAWLERSAAFTRLGAGGVRQVEVTGLVAAMFTHRDSRAGDPDLHTHVAVSNKVQTRDGRWRALDGRVLHKAAVAASERYNTRLEAHLTNRLGVVFAERPGRKADHRPVREIVGMQPRLLAAWSSRRQVIEARRSALASAFQADHGRPPTPVEAIALAQQATLETRPAKHEPRSLAEQRAAWRQEAAAVLGGADSVDRMLDAALHPAQAPTPTPAPKVTDAWLRAAAVEVVDAVAEQRATWQVWHVRAEAERVVRAAAPAPGDVDAAVERIVAAALSAEVSLPLEQGDLVVEPPELRRSDGASVYTVAGAQLYSSRAVLAAEAQLTSAAGRTDGRRADPGIVELALLEAAANGAELNPGQAHLVRQLAGSGARLQLALAAAGTGKTTALAVLARAWTAGGGTVLGLAPSAVATAGLREVLGGTCETLAKLVWSLSAGDHPRWVHDIGPDTLVVVDEAGMAGTRELARATEWILGRGGSVRLVGDSGQLASVAAGGVLAEIAAAHGAASLTELVRFIDPVEGAATAAIRGGDTGALGFYLDHGRVHVGDLATAAAQAYAAWAADRAAGRDALLLAATRDVVQSLNGRARADRLARTSDEAGNLSPTAPGPEVVLGDGTRAGAGDPIITRANNRRLPITGVDWVKNGDRFTVTDVHADGALTVIHSGSRGQLALPAEYVAAHVQLGYATTVHGSQGVTADVCHTVLTGAETRQLLYVALSRGRSANHLYLATAGDGNPHSVVTPAAVFPPTATELLTAMLGRDGAQTSAAAARRAADDPAAALHTAAARFADPLRVAADHHLGPAAGEDLETFAEQLHPGLTSAAAWPTLRGHLALLALAGTDPSTALRQAVDERELASAADPAAVLTWRLPEAGPVGPLPWLPGIPAALAGDRQWGPYLAARAELVTACARRVTDTAAALTPVTAPTWARSLLDLGTDRELDCETTRLRGQLAVWRAAHGVPDDDRRPTGPVQPAAAARRHQHRLDQALAALAPSGPGAVWAALADAIDPRIRRDPHWPDLAERLAAADRAGHDAAALLAAVAGQRPLSDDLPAAALSWRLASHLAPTSAVPAGTSPASGPSQPRPSWCATLLDLRPKVAQRIPADPAWPALVAAVTTGARAGWNPEALITTAAAGLPNLTAHTHLPGGLVGELVFRVAALTSPPPQEHAEPLPADLEPPADARLVLPVADGPETGVPEDVVDLVDLVGPEEGIEEVNGVSNAPMPSGYRFVTPDPFTPAEPSVADDADYLLGEHFWATAPVARDRLIQLNASAAAFYADRYPASWAPGYLRHRLGTDLTGDPRFSPGYAPDGWTALIDHLRGLGATDAELLAAGLAQRARTGALIDRFRDRLTFPIADTDGAVVGFITRHTPAADGDGGAGPKYLNTPRTDLYAKGEHLLGLHENRAALAAGAAPALVEGPLDAIALTLAGDGATVGLALLGTALTDQQANLLRPHLHPGGPGVLVATDNDLAGQQAAERIYGQLTALDDAPRRLALPAGQDPADLLRGHGVSALRAAIDSARPLADHLLDARIARAVGTSASIADIVRDVAEVITALPPSRRLAAIDRATRALDLPIGVIPNAVLGNVPAAAAGRARVRRPQPVPARRPWAADYPSTPRSSAPTRKTSLSFGRDR